VVHLILIWILKIPADGRQQFMVEVRLISASLRGLISHTMPSLVYFWRQNCGALIRADDNFRAKALEGVAPKILKKLVMDFLAVGSNSDIGYRKRK
jgi:hypothetical protein